MSTLRARARLPAFFKLLSSDIVPSNMIDRVKTGFGQARSPIREGRGPRGDHGTQARLSLGLSALSKSQGTPMLLADGENASVMGGFPV